MTDSREELHPTDGARFLFEHVADPAGDETRARYDAAIYTPDTRFGYQADLSADGSAELAATGEPAPADLERKLKTIARVMARDANKNREAGLPPWPHRILRWRGPK